MTKLPTVEYSTIGRGETYLANLAKLAPVTIKSAPINKTPNWLEIVSQPKVKKPSKRKSRK